MLETDDPVQDRPPAPREWIPSYTVQDKYESDRTTTPTEPRESEKTLYEPTVSEDGTQITTFDGRTFTQLDPANNEWQAQCDGESCTVKDLKLHPNKTLTYSLNGRDVAELPNGQKLVQENDQITIHDPHGRVISSRSGRPGQLRDELTSTTGQPGRPGAPAAEGGTRDGLPAPGGGGGRRPAITPGGGGELGEGQLPAPGGAEGGHRAAIPAGGGSEGGGDGDAIPVAGGVGMERGVARETLPALSLAAKNPEVFSSDPTKLESKTYSSAATLLPEVVAGIKDNGRPEDALTHNYFKATSAEGRQRAMADLVEMARTSSDPLVQRRLLDMKLVDRSLLAKSASDILTRTEANGGENQKQEARRHLTEALKDIAKMAQPSGLNPEGLGKSANSHHYSQENATKVLAAFSANGRGAEVHNAVAMAQNETAALPGQAFGEMRRFVADQPTALDRMIARESAVKELEGLNKKSGRDELGEQLRTLKPLKAMLDLQDTSDPAQAVARLAELRRLDEGGNKEALTYLDHLSKKLGGPDKLLELEKTLSAGGKDADKALAELKTKGLSGDDSPAKAKLNELKTDDITRGLTLKSSETELKTAKEKLDREVAEGNKEAVDRAKLLDVAVKLKQMEDPARAPQAMRELIAMSKPDGDKPANPHAREALATMLLSGDKKGLDGYRKILDENGDQHKRLLSPDLSKLSAEQSDALKTDAVKALREGVKSGRPLSTSEAAAMGLALTDVIKRSNIENPLAKEIRGTFDDIFTKKVDKDSRAETTAAASDASAALNGLFRSITHSKESGNAASGMLVYDYLRGASSEHNQRLGDGNIGKEFKDHVQTFKDLAAKGNPEAMSILAGFAGGAGRHNHTAGFNDELARSARDTMVKIASDHPNLREAAIDALTIFPQTLLPDQSRRRETLGMVAALGPTIPDHVRENLRSGLGPGLDRPTRESAINGMMAMAGKLNFDDVKALSDNMSPELRTSLERNKDKFPPEVGHNLTTAMATVALDRSRPADDRIRALEVIAAVGPKHISPDTITALRQLGSESGKHRLERDYEKSYHDAGEKKQVADKVGQIQRGAANALLSVAEHATDPARKMQAFLTFANTDWGLTQAPDRANWVHRLNRLQDSSPDNAIIHAVAPRVMHRLSLDERPHPPQSTEAARLAATFYHRGASDIPDKALLELTRGAIDNYGAKTVGAVADRLAMFNALSPETRRELTKFEGKLADNRSLSLEGRTVDAKTFNALPEDVRKQLFGTADKLKEPERLNLEGKRISAETFNALPPDVRKYIMSGTGVLGKNTDVPAEALKGKSLDAVTFNSLSDASRRALNGTSHYLSEGYAVPDLAGKTIPNANFNKLAPELRRALTGSDAEMQPGEKLSFTGRTLDAAVLNKLPADIRATLTGSEREMAAGTKVTADQLRGKELTAEQFNALPSNLRLQLTGSADERKKGEAPVSLSGKTIDATTFNQLPPELRDHIAGTVEFMAAGRVIKDLSTESIDAKTFNELTPELRGRISATDKPLDATTVLALMNNTTISENDSLARALTSPTFDDQILKMEKDAKTQLATAKTELDALEKFKKEAIKHMSEHSVDGVGWFKKLGSYVGLSDAQRRFIDKQEGHLFGVAALEQVTRLQEKAVQDAAGRVQLFDIANANRQFARHMADGRLRQADHLAVDFVRQHGRAGLALAPDISAALRMTGEGASANPLARLNALGETQHKGLRFNPDIGDREGVATGLKMLRGIEKRNHPDNQPFLDAAITRSEGLAGIDQHPTVKRLQGVSQSVSDQLQVLSSQLEAFQKKGDKFDKFIQDAQERAGKIRAALDSVTSEEIKDLRTVKGAIDEQLKEGKISDPESRKELEKRSKAMDDILRLVDKDYKMPDHSAKITELNKKLNAISTGLEDYVGSNNPQREKILEELRTLHAGSPRQQVEKLLSKLETPEFKDVSDFQTWLKTDGIVLGAATAGAVLATAAIVFSGGTATPLVMAAAATAAGMIAAEGAMELQYKAGMRSDGSRVGRYTRGEQVLNTDGSSRNMHFGWDVAMPYAGELAAGTLMGWASGGIGAKLGEGFARMSPAAKAAFVAENRGALDALARSVAKLDVLAAKNPGFAGFMRVLGKETLTQGIFATGAVAAEKGVHEGAKALGYHLEEGNRLTSFFVGVGLSAMHRGFTARMPQGPIRTGDSLKMQYQSKGFAHERNYMQSAEKRGSKITMTGDGFVEVTKNGLRVEWTRGAGEPAGTTPGGTPRRPKGLDFTPKPGSTRIDPILDSPASPGGGRRTTDARTAADARSHATDGKDQKAKPANPHDPSLPDLKRKVMTEQKINDLNAREAELTKRRNEPGFRDSDGKVGKELGEIAEKKRAAQTQFDEIKLNDSTQKIYDQIKKEHGVAQQESQKAQEALSETQRQIEAEKVAERKRLAGQDDKIIQAHERAIDEKYRTKLAEQEAAALNAGEKVRSALDKGNALVKFIEITGTYPPGEYMITGNRDVPAADRHEQPDYEHTGKTRGVKLVIPEGPPIPKKAIDQVLENINKLGLRPSEVELAAQLGGIRGDFTEYTRDPFFTRIRVRVGETDHHFLSTHTHETGHLFDLKTLYTKGSTATPRDIETQWRKSLIDMDKFPDVGDFRRSDQAVKWIAEVLKDPSHPYHARIKEMGKVGGLQDNDYRGHRDLVCDTVSKPVFDGSPESLKENAQYWNSRSELLAEMYMLHQQKSAALGRGEKPPTYRELVDRYTRPRDDGKTHNRADTMIQYEDLYRFMEKHVFERNALREGAIARFQQQRGPAETGAVRDALRKHGPESPEYTKAVDAARAESLRRIPDAAVREVFARDQHISPKFDPDHLPAAQRAQYEQYLKLQNPGFNPHTDPSVPPGMRETLASAKGKFDVLEGQMRDFNGRRLEAMRDGLTRDYLRDFLSKQERNFLNSMHNAWDAGLRKAHAASKSREPYKPFKEPATGAEIKTPEAYRDWLKSESRLDTINNLYKLHQMNIAREAGGLKPLPFEQLLQVATATKAISTDKAAALKHHDALFNHLGRKVIPHMKASAGR